MLEDGAGVQSASGVLVEPSMSTFDGHVRCTRAHAQNAIPQKHCLARAGAFLREHFFDHVADEDINVVGKRDEWTKQHKDVFKQ